MAQSRRARGCLFTIQPRNCLLQRSRLTTGLCTGHCWVCKAAELRQGEIAGSPEWSRKIIVGTTADAQAALGEAYAYGNGVVQDYTQAAAWYPRAADLGNAYAQRDLGDLYCNGGVIKFVDVPGGSKRGIRDDGGGEFPKDYSLAAIWYRKAAEQGDEYSQNSLGILFDNGQGVPQDYEQRGVQ